MLVYIVLIGILTTSIYSESVAKKEIVIAGLFPTSRDIPAGAIGRGVRPAVQLALDMVNNDTTILKDYILRMTSNDTECDMAKATKIFFDMMDENTTKVMLFGDACSNVTGPMAQISKWWNMWQLSYADTDPKLSDRSTYSNFFRTVPSDTDFNPAMIAILRYFNWTRVGTIFQDPSTGSDRYGIAHSRLIELLDDAGIDVVKVESFLAEPDTAVTHLKAHDARVIVGFFDHEMARKVFCSARKRGMYGQKYQWIIMGDYPPNWWRSNHTDDCSNKEMEVAIEGYLSSEVLPLSSSDEVTISGLTAYEYFQLYNTSRGLEFSKYHGYAFDGIWVIAKAMDQILRHTDPTSIKEETFRGPPVASALNETNFMGVTGRVQFDGADRIGHVLLLQYQGGVMVKIGEYKRANDDLMLLDTIRWQGNGPPRDRNLRRWEVQRVSVAAYSVICFLAGIGIVMATVFLIFNIIFRNHGYIKMSSPYMNNVIIVGCILCYLSVFLLGTDSGVVPTHIVKYVCVAQSWVLSIGFSLAFGAMFSKTWRVHAIFTNIKLNKKIIKDYKLFIMVCVLVLIDAGILSAWQIMDHLYMTTKDLPALVVGEYEVIPTIEYCTSNAMKIWLGSLYAYKGLLLVFGCFLAWETKNVTISALNDSKYIGMSVYNVVIMCVCGAAISFIIKDQPTPAFVIISLFIVFCTTITLCLVFVPKMVELHRDPAGEGRRIRATLRRKKKRAQENGTTFQKRIKDVIEENERYKEIIKEKSAEIKSLLEQLGEDTSAYDVEFRPQLHKKVIELRMSDLSPASSATEMDHMSSFSDVSAFTHTTCTDSPQVRQRHLLRSNRSMGGSDTDCMELAETNCKKPNCYKPSTRQLSGESDGCRLKNGPTETDKIDFSSTENYGYTSTLDNSCVQMNDKGVQAGEGQLSRRPRWKPPCKESACINKYETVASISERTVEMSPSRRLNALIQCSPMTVNALVHEEETIPAPAWQHGYIGRGKGEPDVLEPLLEGCRQAAAKSCGSTKKRKLETRLDDITE
ncbi:LOW QUALITY PROTEIN: gamma-aminobutyric acid type B receptor subunit 2-like [Pecten maximus]|uniref:LOW QUALITY PROTEIN: gamma-aminobutyric acid type B receptor subunit 2-like n=1 Tax=Pecten maximus TaxID=6579 RepID=UPI001458F58D|nr:LOW QUALITY PROTEIN: gamma-aminobutyric acid type B receptor subunit 2-like [Pecten maximus]